MPARVVITGVGIVSPLGIGRDAVWRGLCEGRSGLGPITSFDPAGLPVRVAGEVPDFDPRQYVRPRKSLKVMSRDGQLAVAAADLARADARLAPDDVDPERIGVILGADPVRQEMAESEPTYRYCRDQGRMCFSRWGAGGMQQGYPLGMLKLLPNMPACHVSILHDARGPTNTLYHCELSGLLALTEAVHVIERGWADVMLAGGASSRMQPLDWVRDALHLELSHWDGDPVEACRPFDAQRDGQVRGEGAAVLVLESLRHARERGATILAHFAGTGGAFEPAGGAHARQGNDIRRSLAASLADAGLSRSDVGFASAHGLGTRVDDALEARALADVLPGVPVTALKSRWGNLFAAGGAVELAAATLALSRGLVPETRNYRTPDPACPAPVVHGGPLETSRPAAIVLSHTSFGQSAAAVLRAA